MDDRLGKLEDKVSLLATNVTQFHSEMKQLTNALDRITISMDKMIEVQIDQRVFKEQCEQRHKDLKEMDKLLHARIDKVNAELEKTTLDHSRVDRLDNILWGIIKWGGLVGGSAIVSSVIYVANHGGIK